MPSALKGYILSPNCEKGPFMISEYFYNVKGKYLGKKQLFYGSLDDLTKEEKEEYFDILDWCSDYNGFRGCIEIKIRTIIV